MPVFQRGDVQLHYELNGSGQPVVYISGFGAHSNDTLSKPLRAVMAENYTVLAVDNRGSGQTLTPPGADASLADMADDIAAIMAHHALGPAHVLGISMGGCIAMLLALRHPDRVKTLAVAVSLAWSKANSRSEFIVRTTRRMRDAGIPREFQNRQSAIVLLSDDVFQHETFIETWVNAPPDPFVQSAEGFELQIQALNGYDIRADLPRITAPTLVFSSPDDILVPPHYQDEIAALIPNAQIRRYPGGHVFMALPMYSPGFLQDLYTFWEAQPS
jgi:pimeloyl-ACP methyl ester carboxylesterase